MYRRRRSILTRIDTISDEQYSLIRRIPVVIEPSSTNDGYIASFFDAGISANSDSEQDALDKLKSLIIHTLEDLIAQPAEKLRVEDTRQLRVLLQYLSPSMAPAR